MISRVNESRKFVKRLCSSTELLFIKSPKAQVNALSADSSESIDVNMT